jgi:hypothetical protein
MKDDRPPAIVLCLVPEEQAAVLPRHYALRQDRDFRAIDEVKRVRRAMLQELLAESCLAIVQRSGGGFVGD